MTADELRQLKARKCECWSDATFRHWRCPRCLAVDAALSQAADRIAELTAALRWALAEGQFAHCNYDETLFVCLECNAPISYPAETIEHTPDCKYARALRALEGAV